MRHDYINHSRLDGFFMFSIKDNQEIRNQRHNLPEYEENKRVAYANHESHG